MIIMDKEQLEEMVEATVISEETPLENKELQDYEEEVEEKEGE
jgi:hypothetical protein